MNNAYDLSVGVGGKGPQEYEMAFSAAYISPVLGLSSLK